MIKIENYNKTFHLKSGDVQALKNVSLDIQDGEKYGVIGYSGAGKSTLVRCINFLEIPDDGRISIGDVSIEIREGILYKDGKKLSEKELIDCGIGEDFIRLSVGLEDIDDLISDVENALNAIGDTWAHVELGRHRAEVLAKSPKSEEDFRSALIGTPYRVTSFAEKQQ